MKKQLIVIPLLFLFFSCEKVKEKLVIEDPQQIEVKEISNEEINEINLIIEAVLNHSDLDLLKSDKDSDDLVLDYLYRIKVIEAPAKTDDFLPPKELEIFYTELIGAKHKEHFLFTPEDSLYVIQQNYYPNKLKIADAILEKYNTEESIKQKLKDNPDLYFSKLKLSIPILSKDKQKAYVKTSYNCGELCGDGQTLILIKINEIWTVKAALEQWVS